MFSFDCIVVETKDISSEEILQYSRKVVSHFVSKGTVPKRNAEDIIMYVVEKFLLKKETVINNFRGNSKFSTYIISVLNKMCLEVIRKEIKHWNYPNQDFDFSKIFSTESENSKLYIKDEISVLKKILILFGKERYKIILFFAYYFRLQIMDATITNYTDNKNPKKIRFLLNNNPDFKKSEVFNILAILVNQTEKKEIKSDAVRLWMEKKQTIIIDRLNRASGHNMYTKDTFKTLFEYYYLSYNNEHATNIKPLKK